MQRTGTSHISIVDDTGNAVSMTTTIESAFGSRVMAAGFLLNNQLTDFSFQPVDAAGRTIANAVGPGKRPRSSMAPTMVFDGGGQLRMVIGSPGGARIILYVIKTLVALVDWRLEPQAAVALTNFGSMGITFEIEDDAGPTLSWRHMTAAAQAATLSIWMRGRGHRTSFPDMTSGTHVIAIDDAGLSGGADPRREGVARGR
jgi:gamma-glutamyltranspeptidase / glutathione hydrolase